MSNSPQSQFGATPLNQFSFKLRGERWNESDWKRPELTLDMVNNNPRFVVFCNNPSEAEKTREVDGRTKKVANTPISCRMKWSDFWKFTFLMEEVIASSEPIEFSMSFKGAKYENGQKVPGKTVVNSRLSFGQDSDGCIYMKIYEKDRDKALFRFADEYWVPIQQDGQELPKAKNSKLSARSWWMQIMEVCGPLAVAYYVPQAGREVKDQRTNKPTAAPKTDDIVVNEDDGWE
ncbi:hypothetical protein [Vibrio phage vB_pir03]|nr:hypothetical protein [Vibrio phage vB_pir03]